MSKPISIDIASPDIEKRLQALSNVRNGAPRAMMRAINRTLEGMGTDAAEELTSRYIIKPGEVKRKLNLKDKATTSKLSVSMRSNGRPLRLVKFRTQPNQNPGRAGGQPVHAQVKHSRSGNFIRASSNRSNAFMANFRAGTDSHGGAFVRTGKKTEATSLRENIRQLHGPGVVQMLDHEEVREVIQTNAEKRFDTRLDHEINHLLDKG